MVESSRPGEDWEVEGFFLFAYAHKGPFESGVQRKNFHSQYFLFKEELRREEDRTFLHNNP